ncbi:hypothetical protein PHYSODRAFT_325275 [Phytophthora sojae]|uniref:RxLR effector protein n=1 Tax=Phytophthora sojae (strain P6497) TaxID=1094619 RepID=G4YS00_PHYSP|nr:hypothetical protein PHYSODRAFT_325275 [Phytophthora sojae]EGZ24137.1 hypothetical protein PHYSODRAFT_325275 [Phytophthora sojae]|eukprot:XP_009519425.1 hypothetical protein PHYSODRAFT_325275 [Phytophthora sojae]
MNIKGLFALTVVALVGMANTEAAVSEDHVARELQVADFSTKLLNAVNAKRAEKGLKATSVDAVVATWIKSLSAYLYDDLKFIGPGYAYDKTKVYKHYWVLDLANAAGESCA